MLKQQPCEWLCQALLSSLRQGISKGCGSHAVLVLALRQIRASRKMNQREPTYVFWLSLIQCFCLIPKPWSCGPSLFSLWKASYYLLPKQSSLLKQSTKLGVFFHCRGACYDTVLMDLNRKQVHGQDMGLVLSSLSKTTILESRALCDAPSPSSRLGLSRIFLIFSHWTFLGIHGL